TPTTTHTLSLHDALPIYRHDGYPQTLPLEVRHHHLEAFVLLPQTVGNRYPAVLEHQLGCVGRAPAQLLELPSDREARRVLLHHRSEEHTSELQSRGHLVC